MEKTNINILCTRPIDNSLIEKARQRNIEIEVLSFIETDLIKSIETQREIKKAFQQKITVVFTSMNAVDAVTAASEALQPDWRIFCIGNTTNKLVKENFGEAAIAGTAASAEDLANLISEEKISGNVIFFCGNQRRDELPDILRNNDIKVKEIVVYKTVHIPHKIDKEYQGILFFSPSAVQSFFSTNKLPDTTILFAIGKTTANEIMQYSPNKIIMSTEAGKENLVEKMMAFYS